MIFVRIHSQGGKQPVMWVGTVWLALQIWDPSKMEVQVATFKMEDLNASQ